MASKTLRSECRGRRLRVIVGGRWRCKHSHSASDRSEGYVMLMHESIRSRTCFHIAKHALRPMPCPVLREPKHISYLLPAISKPRRALPMT